MSARLYNAILEIVRALATEHSQPRLFEALLRRIREVVPATSVSIGITDKHGMFELALADPPFPAPTQRADDYPRSFAKAERWSFDQLGPYPMAQQIWAKRGVVTALVVPLIVAGQRVGALNISHGDPHAYDDVDLDAIDELAAAVAVVIDSCRARERLEILRDQQEAELEELSDELRLRQSADGVIGDCEAFRACQQLVELVGPTEATVLLAGETGSGKDVVARAIHEASPRRARPFVTINCAAVPSNLAESELFGHEAGAFTGAAKRRIGHFERAAGGTLFLDEVGELALDVQAKLLRALQERVIERVGGSELVPLDVRIVAATNRDLLEQVRARRFREDLYYRLAVFPIEIPPLRARREDIPALAGFFARHAALRMRRPARTIDDDTMARLCGYDWPGNVRELQNAIERATIISTGAHLELDAMLPAAVIARPRPPPARAILPAGAEGDEQAVRDEYARALDATGWVIEGAAGAAARLGIHPNTLRYRLKRLGLQRPG